MNSVTLLSPAKVNLTLEVLSKRPDGYHEIRSIMQPLNLFDEVTVESLDGSGIQIEASGFKIPLGEDNLAWKAAKLYLKKSGIEKRVKISIKKMIPLGAGLGGGSGNAAAVLVGLNKLKRKLSEGELLKLSAQLGADVPFFIHCRTALAEGIGDKLTLIKDFPLLHYVLVYPGFETSAKRVYEAWSKAEKNGLVCGEIENTIALFKSGKLPLCNDLEKLAMTLYPEIKKLKEMLSDLEMEAIAMTGSGSTVFGVFQSEQKARGVYEYLKNSNTLKVFSAQGISGWHRL